MKLGKTEHEQCTRTVGMCNNVKKEIGVQQAKEPKKQDLRIIERWMEYRTNLYVT